MCSPNTGSSPKSLSYQSRSPSKWWRGSAATTPWCKARQKMGTRLKETWSSGRCSFLLATIFESWTFGQSCSGSLSRPGPDHAGCVLPPPLSRRHLLCHDDQRDLRPWWKDHYCHWCQSRTWDQSFSTRHLNVSVCAIKIQLIYSSLMHAMMTNGTCVGLSDKCKKCFLISFTKIN